MHRRLANLSAASRFAPRRAAILLVLAGGCAILVHRPSRAADHASPEGLRVFQTGDLPIILSAPHGGREAIPGVPQRRGDAARKFATVRDENTAELAESLGAALQKNLGAKPYLVIARFARKYADANRPAADAYESPAAQACYEAYHQALRTACREVRDRWGGGLLVDLHGQAAEGETVFRGTGGGQTVALLRQRCGSDALCGPNSLLGYLEDHGYRVVPARKSDQREDPRFNGGYIVRTYGGTAGPGVDAIQLELGTQLRARARLEQTAADLARAIQVFARAYLPLRKRGDPPAGTSPRDR
jgi:N-formylglutamate amidohydrolase